MVWCLTYHPLVVRPFEVGPVSIVAEGGLLNRSSEIIDASHVREQTNPGKSFGGPEFFAVLSESILVRSRRTLGARQRRGSTGLTEVIGSSLRHCHAAVLMLKLCLHPLRDTLQRFKLTA